ncbi:MAG: Nif11-like leader peptide family natural product precursor [Cyanobacteriota bacterium]|nr:Nif11-like leader peptide family natural product precursor [Cyanobacteriota bacterium]
MSRAELERLVADAETNTSLRELLRASRTPSELVLCARQQGYHITRVDLQRAWLEHQGGPETRVSGG